MVAGERIALGMIGVGGIAEAHLAAIAAHPAFHLAAVCDIDAARVRPLVERYHVHACDDCGELLRYPLDAVVVNLPHDLHERVALDAVAAGRHVLLEKPLAIEVGQMNRVLEAADRAGVVLHVAEIAEHLPAVRLGKAQIEAGRLGRFLLGHCVNYRAYLTAQRPVWFLDPARSGGGQFLNIGVHRLAMVRTLLGEDGPEEVAVTASVFQPQRDAAIETAASVLVQYDDGACMHYEECGHLHPPEQLKPHLRMTWERGVLTITSDGLWWSDADGRTQHHAIDPAPPGEMYAPVYGAFLDAIRHDGPRLKGREAARDARIALAAYAAARERRRINLREPAWTLYHPRPTSPTLETSPAHTR